MMWLGDYLSMEIKDEWFGLDCFTGTSGILRVVEVVIKDCVD